MPSVINSIKFNRFTKSRHFALKAEDRFKNKPQRAPAQDCIDRSDSGDDCLYAYVDFGQITRARNQRYPGPSQSADSKRLVLPVLSKFGRNSGACHGELAGKADASVALTVAIRQATIRRLVNRRADAVSSSPIRADPWVQSCEGLIPLKATQANKPSSNLAVLQVLPISSLRRQLIQ